MFLVMLAMSPANLATNNLILIFLIFNFYFSDATRNRETKNMENARFNRVTWKCQEQNITYSGKTN